MQIIILKAENNISAVVIFFISSGDTQTSM